VDLEEAQGVGIANANYVADQVQDWEAQGYDEPQEMVYGYNENIAETLRELGVRRYENREDADLDTAADNAFWARLVELGTIKYPLDEDASQEAGEDIYSEDWVFVQQGLGAAKPAPVEGYYLSKASTREDHSIFYGPMSKEDARVAVILMHDPSEPTGNQLHAWYNFHGYPSGLSVDYLTPGEISYLLEGYEVTGEFRSYRRMRGRIHPRWPEFSDGDPVAWIHRNWDVDGLGAVEHVALDEYGERFETGVPVTVRYVRGTMAAPPPTPDDRYQQRIEPTGRYMLHQPAPGDLHSDWEAGEVSFRNPLVIAFSTKADGGYDEHSWKVQLSEQYDGLVGKNLSRAIADDGYDGIVTVSVRPDGTARDTREIVDLTWMHA
jgi:hypothetical protein